MWLSDWLMAYYSAPIDSGARKKKKTRDVFEEAKHDKIIG